MGRTNRYIRQVGWFAKCAVSSNATIVFADAVDGQLAGGLMPFRYFALRTERTMNKILLAAVALSILVLNGCASRPVTRAEYSGLPPFR